MMTQGKNAIKKMGIISVTLLLHIVTLDVTTVTNAMVKSAVGLWNGLSKNAKMIKILQLVKKQTAGK